jgi:TonB-linked SusC/RagA family outer membrane protein
MSKKRNYALFTFKVTCFLLLFFTCNLSAESNLYTQQGQKRISGHVKDIAGEPLVGVTIFFPGTPVGTLTNLDGNFSVEVPENVESFKVSFVGMHSQEIQIGNQTTFNITMEEESVSLQEVVAVGYAMQKKESIVGAITQATDEQLKKRGNVTDMKQALSGQIPGLTTITSSGEPGGVGRGGSSTQFFIRGQNTWNGGQPLILVDGVERAMENIDVNEVETISVLKDASATAVFGVKGANGVILINTKRGSSSTPQISFSYNTTAKMLSKVPRKLDSYNALLVKNEAIEREVVLNEPSWSDYLPYEIVQRYKTPQTDEYAILYPNVDWEKALFKDVGFSHKAALNISGGTNVIRYFGSLAYLHEGDMFKDYNNYKGYNPNYNFDRFNFRSNLDINLTKTTQLKVNLSGFFSNKNQTYANEGSASSADYMIWRSVYVFPPDVYLPQYDDGRWGYSNKVTTWNPAATLYNMGIRETKRTLLSSNFELQQKLDMITKGLTTKFLFTFDNDVISEGGIFDVGNHIRPNEVTSNTPAKQINADLYLYPGQNPEEYTTNLPVTGQSYFDWILRPWTLRPELIRAGNFEKWIPVTRRMSGQIQLEYARKFNLHDVGIMALVKREEYARGNMFKNYREDWVFRSTYNYDTKYLFEFNGAYNGSEQFGPGYRFDFFPSVAVGWYLSREDFFKIAWIDRLKLRYSFGMVGDDKLGSDRWLYVTQWSYGGSSPLGSTARKQSPYTWYKEEVMGNPDIHWEKAAKQNYGLEFGAFKNALSLTCDYFRENRSDILLAGNLRNIPSFFGGVAPAANLGKVRSAGFELEIKWDKRYRNSFRYWASLAFTHTENKVTFKDDPQLLPDYMKNEGFSIGQHRSAIATGFYNNWDEVYASIPTETNDQYKLPGYYDLIDFNGDGIYKSSEDDIPCGYSEIPMNTYSFFVGTDYKGFSIMAQLYGVNNASRYVALRNFWARYTTVYAHVEDAWSKENPNASSFLPRWQTQGQNIGDYYLYDASYLRLKTVELAYAFNKKHQWIQSMKIEKLRVYLNGSDLFLWSKLPDDIEGGGRSALYGTYPTVKRINLGVDITF